MKRTISIFTILFSLFIAINSVYATDSNTGVSNEDEVQDLPQEEIDSKIAETEKEALKTTMATNNQISPRAAYNDRTYSMYVTNFKQEKTTWCGPAVTRQALSFHRAYNHMTISLPSQSTLASKLGTISAGATSSAAIANVMNSYKTTFRLKQSYTATNVLDKTSPSAFFSSALKSQIKGAYTAPIILIDTGHDSGISQYRGVRYRHYNTIKAVVDRENYSTGTSIVISATRVDPHYDNKYYGVYSNPISQIYQAVTQAERNGSNKVLEY